MLCNGKESKHQNLVSGWSEEGVVDMENSEFVTEPDQCKLNFENDPDQLVNFFGMDHPTDIKTASLAIIANAIMNLDEFLTHG